MSIQAIVFDMDGVLLDTETICQRCWASAAQEFNLADGVEVQMKCLGTNKNDTRAILKQHYGEDFDCTSFLSRTSELFHEIERTEGIPLMPFVKETLEYLKPKYRLAVASSTRTPVVIKELTDAGIIQYFEKIICGDMVTHSKPDPEIYLMACNELGLSPDQCVAIEDSPNGIKSANAAGMLPVMVPDKIQPSDELKKLCWKICHSLKEAASNL